MAIWPFNRKQKVDQSLLPDEVSEYYKGGKSSSSRGSWLLALGTMIVTAVLAVALFFGGRWVFQAIFDNDDDNTQTVQQTDDNQVEVKVTEPTVGSDGSTDTNKDSDSSTDTQSGTDGSTSTSDDSAVSEDQTPTTGGINEIPDTGPGAGGLQ